MPAILAILYREYRIRVTNMIFLSWDLLIPVGYLVIFRAGFAGITKGQVFWGQQALSYGSFLLGGVLTGASYGTAGGAAWSLFTDRDNGIFDEFLTYPLSRSQFLLGKILFNILVALGRGVICLLVAVFFLDIPLAWRLLPWLVVGMVIGTAGWFFFLMNFALRIRRNDLFNTLIEMSFFFLLFASSMYYPLEPLPAWLRAVASANPMTWQADFLRYATLGIGGSARLALEAMLFCGFSAICFWMAVGRLQRPE
jgi:ABC-2 type transport system permease protein